MFTGTSKEDLMAVECKPLSTPLIGRIGEGRTPIARADEYLRYSVEHGIAEIAKIAKKIDQFAPEASACSFA